MKPQIPAKESVVLLFLFVDAKKSRTRAYKALAMSKKNSTFV